MKTNIYHLIILDESGSMESIKKAAVSGCNETIQSIRFIQKKYAELQNHFVSLVTFNSENSTKIIFDKMPIHEVRTFAEKQYNPNNCTPLYDAMGLSFMHLQNSMDRQEKSSVLATIITDGLENSSTVFNGKKLSSLIDELGKNGWTFAYIGANQDVVRESEKLNICNNLAFETNELGTDKMYGKLAKARMKYCACVAEDMECRNNIFDEEND